MYLLMVTALSFHNKTCSEPSQTFFKNRDEAQTIQLGPFALGDNDTDF